MALLEWIQNFKSSKKCVHSRTRHSFKTTNQILQGQMSCMRIKEKKTKDKTKT